MKWTTGRQPRPDLGGVGGASHGPRVKACKEQNPTPASAKKCRQGGQGAGGRAGPRSPQAGVPGAQEGTGPGPLSGVAHSPWVASHAGLGYGSLTCPAQPPLTRLWVGSCVAWPGSGAGCMESLAQGGQPGVLGIAGARPAPQGGGGAGGGGPGAGFACPTAGSGRAWEAGIVTG